MISAHQNGIFGIFIHFQAFLVIFHGTGKWQNLGDTVSPILHFLTLIPFFGYSGRFWSHNINGSSSKLTVKNWRPFFSGISRFFLPKNHKCAPLTCFPNCVWDHFVHYDTQDGRYSHSGSSGEVSGHVKVGFFSPNQPEMAKKMPKSGISVVACLAHQFWSMALPIYLYYLWLACSLAAVQL